MLFSLLVLATPRIGPPPNVCAPRLELLTEFGDDDPDEDDPEEDDPFEFEFPSASEFPAEELSDEAPDAAFPELPLAEF
jgi:hypothetical protein